MDDWFTIVLFFLFFVLPMLEGVLKKKRKGPRREGGTPPGAQRGSLPAPVAVEPALPRGRGTTTADDSSWSDGWGSWPGEELEEEPEEAVPSWTGTESPDRSRTGTSPAEYAPAPAEISTRSPDLLTVPEAGQPSELQRLQELAARLDRIALTETSPPRPGSAPVPVAALEPKRPRAPRQASVLLPDRASVRHALIVSEVLGPPLAIRDRPPT